MQDGEPLLARETASTRKNARENICPAGRIHQEDAANRYGYNDNIPSLVRRVYENLRPPSVNKLTRSSVAENEAEREGAWDAPDGMKQCPDGNTDPLSECSYRRHYYPSICC